MSDSVILNRINQTHNVSTNYSVNTANRYLSVYCFPCGEIIIYGCYDNNYSFWISKSEFEDEEYYSEIINRILYGDFKYMCYRATSYKSVAGISYDELYESYQIHFILKDGQILIKKHDKFEDHSELPNLGIYIDSEIKRIYKEKDIRSNPEIKEELIYIKRQILSCDVMKYFQIIVPIRGYLYDMQYLVFSENAISSLYIECNKLCGEMYNRYMTIAR